MPRVLAEHDVRGAELPSTRSVTSSRLPIGVAQTASGISRAPCRPRIACAPPSGYRNPPNGRPGDKPYKVYRGGRTKGKVPLAGADARRSARKQRSAAAAVRLRPSGRAPPARAGRGSAALRAAAAPRRAARRLGRRRATSPSAAASPPRTAACRRDAAALKPQNGLLCSRTRRTSCCSAPTTRQRPGGPQLRPALRLDDAAAHRSGRHRLVFLSIPRDLRASIPGYGESKINAAMQIGGPKLAIQTVRSSPACRSTMS